MYIAVLFGQNKPHAIVKNVVCVIALVRNAKFLFTDCPSKFYYSIYEFQEVLKNCIQKLHNQSKTKIKGEKSYKLFLRY